MRSNKILKAILFISIVLIGAIYFLYRPSTFPIGLQALESIVSVIILSMTLLFISKAKPKWLNIIKIRNIELGLYFGLLWTVEISINNIIRPGLPLRDIVDNSFWASIAILILFTAIYYAYHTKKISQGMISGFWSGLASGAVACISALILIVFGMNLILLDPLNIKEWNDIKTISNLNSMATYYAYQTLAGAIMHLVILGALMGVLLGFIGGIIGKTYRTLKNK